jgi:hypothetical protein
MTTEIMIQTPTGAIPAVAHDRIAGLAIISLATLDRYSIAHEASGLRIWPKYDYWCLFTLEAAQQALSVALASGVDWTADTESVKAQVGSGWRALANRMRLAAEPPRRPRWHKGVQRRRLKPYEAQSKAKTLREAATLGEIGRGMWRDFWAYRRRGEMWGIIPAVQRQPCARFGLTRESRWIEEAA